MFIALLTAFLAVGFIILKNSVVGIVNLNCMNVAAAGLKFYLSFDGLYLQGSDIKALRSFYQKHIENLRLQQNGSLVFR